MEGSIRIIIVMSKDRQESSWGDNPDLLERIQVRQMMIAGDDKIGLPLNGTFKVLGITWIGLQGGKLDRSGNDNGHGSELVDKFGEGLFRAVKPISNLWVSEDAEEFSADGIGEKQENLFTANQPHNQIRI